MATVHTVFDATNAKFGQGAALLHEYDHVNQQAKLYQLFKEGDDNTTDLDTRLAVMEGKYHGAVADPTALVALATVGASAVISDEELVMVSSVAGDATDDVTGQQLYRFDGGVGATAATNAPYVYRPSDYVDRGNFLLVEGMENTTQLTAAAVIAAGDLVAGVGGARATVSSGVTTTNVTDNNAHRVATDIYHGTMRSNVVSVDLKVAAPVTNVFMLLGTIGYQFVPRRAVFHCTAANTLAADAVARFSYSNGGAGDLMSNFPLTGFDTKQDVFVVNFSGHMEQVLGNNGTLEVELTTPDGGTSGTANVYIEGDYFPVAP